MEAYLGLQYVPFEHTACSERCAHILAEKFEKIQKRLRKQKDKEYERLVKQYATNEQPVRTKKVKQRREIDIAETWQLDMYGKPYRRNRFTSQFSSHHTGHRSRERSKCTLF